MSKTWGKLGAWAADAEQAELEEKEAALQAAASSAASPSFPPLKEAVTTKPKKKHNKMSLQEFTTGTGAGGGSARLTHDEMLRLPKGPQERSGDEMYGKIGGGFRDYGGIGGNRGGGSHRDGGGSHRSYGGFEGGSGRGGGVGLDSEVVGSRADEVDNWALSKKPVNSVERGGIERGGSKYGGFGGRADEVDNWVVGKKPNVGSVGGPGQGRGVSSFGSGFRDNDRGNDRNDRWTRGGGGGGFGGGEEQQRPRLVLDKPRTDGVGNEGSGGGGKVVGSKPNPFGAARPREEVLSEKGLDWRKVDLEIEAKKSSSRPSSGQSSRPGSAQSERGEGGVGVQQGVMKVKVNPFGDAKPREVLLEEKGLDWKKIDLDLERRRVDRAETEVEKNLKVEIDHLKRELEIESASDDKSESQQASGQEQTNLHDRILQKEKELEQITRELDDKVRFVQKPIERPGSGSGRSSVVPERPHFRSGSFGEPRNIEFTERPRSRGTGDAWPRQRDERRGFQGGGRERGFLGSRDVDRSGDRW
ncbi:eukaryotic translation initiation factor 4B2-like [Heracleum sosnowskyi]|uniref:Eukaryotic translation initiation factor 4B2-like n=1 Tax=Heracleum sosnowskyi TaxID=360622 RepID=A0AAD8MR01_9APIA|nr:eukaryotic translation initiation factor 4B2-like [Heracleum sosnowskyi]